MKVGELVAKFAAKSGINLADEKNKDMATALATIATEIPDEQAYKIVGSMYNEDDVKNNLNFKKYFNAGVFDVGEIELKNSMDEFGLDPADREAITTADSFFKKLRILPRQIAALEKKKSEATGKDKGDLQKQINELTTQLSEIPKTYEERIKNINSEWENKLTQTQVRSILNGKKWANDKIPLDVNVETGLIFTNRELEKSGAKIININGALKLVQLKDESLDWISPSNEKPTPEQFLDGILASNKLLAVTTAPPPPGGGGNPNPLPIPGGGNGNANPSIMYSMQEDLKAVEAIPN